VQSARIKGNADKAGEKSSIPAPVQVMKEKPEERDDAPREERWRKLGRLSQVAQAEFRKKDRLPESDVRG